MTSQLSRIPQFFENNHPTSRQDVIALPHRSILTKFPQLISDVRHYRRDSPAGGGGACPSLRQRSGVPTARALISDLDQSRNVSTGATRACIIHTDSGIPEIWCKAERDPGRGIARRRAKHRQSERRKPRVPGTPAGRRLAHTYRHSGPVVVLCRFVLPASLPTLYCVKM